MIAGSGPALSGANATLGQHLSGGLGGQPRSGGANQSLLLSAYRLMPMKHCFRLDLHLTLMDWRRTLASAGISMLISSAMIAITTSSSTRVKPRRFVRVVVISDCPSLLLP